MKSSTPFLAVLLVLAAGGCASTPESRISKNQSEFSSWSPEVQNKIRDGKVELGFTQEQVRLALGAPDRTFNRTTSSGTSEIWAYRDKRSSWSFGVGLGFGSRNSSVGTGVAVNPNGYRPDERTHVIFEGGRVTALETSKD